MFAFRISFFESGSLGFVILYTLKRSRITYRADFGPASKKTWVSRNHTLAEPKDERCLKYSLSVWAEEQVLDFRIKRRVEDMRICV